MESPKRFQHYFVLFIFAVVLAVVGGIIFSKTLGLELILSSAVFFVISFLTALGTLLFINTGSWGHLGSLIKHVEQLNKDEKTLSDPIDFSLQGEAGKLTQELDLFIKDLNTKFKAFKGHSDTLNKTAQNMLELSAQAIQRCDSTKQNTGLLSEEGSSVNDNIGSVAAAVEQCTTNVGMVAAAAEEMHATISEIAKSMEQARNVTSKAVEISGNVSRSMDKLGEASKGITNITDTISEISDQTNLLALNATIESARAGEAGKGFAVVANEIKSLANQTSEATLQIKEMISGINNLTNESTTHIIDINQIINSISETVNGVATAVEEQSSAMQEISVNANHASDGISEISNSISQASAATSDISANINTICEDSLGVALAVFESKINAEEVKEISDHLNDSITSLSAGKAKFDIGAVKLAHMAWRVNLEAVLAGNKKMEPDQVTKHTECAFGQWYFSEGSDIFSSFDLFNEMGDYHENVHNLAREVIGNYNKGNKEAAHEKMKEFLRAKDSMFESLDKLYLL